MSNDAVLSTAGPETIKKKKSESEQRQNAV